MARPIVRWLLCLLISFVCSPLLRAADENPADHKGPGCQPKEKDRNRHESFLKQKEEALKKGPIDLVFIGDSIADFWGGGEQHTIYQKYYGKYNPYNIGISADETQHVLWRLQHGELDGIKPKVVEIMIGTNNLGNSHQTPEQTIEGIECVIKTVHEKVPDAKILLMGVFPRGQAATDPFREKIRQVNEAISKLDGKDNVKFLDINAKFLSSDGVLPKDIMPDSLHPNAKGYQIWADAMDPVLIELMK